MRRPADDTDIGLMIPYRRVSFGLDADGAERRPGHRFRRDPSASRTIPTRPRPACSTALLRLPFEMVVSESFAPVRAPDLARADGPCALRRLRSADEEARAERCRHDAPRATSSAPAAVGFGDHHLTMLVRERRPRPARRRQRLLRRRARRYRRDRGARGHQSRTGLLGPVPRQRGLSRPPRDDLDRQYGELRLAPRLALGQADGNHWGDAVTLLETTSATPFFFNFHNGDLGNFSIIGPSGSGKTVVMNFLAAQAQKFAPPHDPVRQGPRRRSCSCAGSAGGTTGSPRACPTGFNPLGLARHADQPRLPARLAGRAAEGRRARGTEHDLGRRSMRPMPTIRRCAACATSRNCWPAPGARNRATWPTAWPHGSSRRRAWLAVRQCR